MARGQAPKIAVFGSADSRVPVELLFDADAGELFTVRTGGHDLDEAAVASLAYACTTLGTETLVVLGNTTGDADAGHCGGHAGLVGQAENVRAKVQTLLDEFGNSLPDIEIVGAVFDMASGKVVFMDDALQFRFATKRSPLPSPLKFVLDTADDNARYSGFFCCVPARRTQPVMKKIEFKEESPKRALLEGNSRYVSNQMKPKGCGDWRHREILSRGQAPAVAVLGCTDSRVPVELIFDADAGEIFTLRAAGVVVNPGHLASLEYACTHLGTRAVVVLGHCGGGGGCGDPAAENVRVQMRTLHASLRVGFKKIKLLGAVFDRETGKVTFLDEDGLPSCTQVPCHMCGYI